MRTINEGSAITVNAAPRDEDNLPVTPSSAQYRIDCLTTGVEVLGWTAIASPTDSNDIDVPGTLNAIVSTNNPRERKQLVFQTVAGGETRNDTLDWEVRNIYGVR